MDDLDDLDYLDDLDDLGDALTMCSAAAQDLTEFEPTERQEVLDLYTDFPFALLQEQYDFLVQAQLSGYAGVLATENRHDAFLPVAASARIGQRIKSGVGVIALLAHHPFAVAQKAWDLHCNTGERFILGVCTHQDAHLEGRLGLSSDRKHQRAFEAIQLIREIWLSWMEDRDPTFRGEFYSISVCPPGYRPLTRLSSLPEIHLLCTSAEDVDLGISAVDALFTHPIWTMDYISRHVTPKLALASKALPVISSPILSTGLSDREYRVSHEQAKSRLLGYIMRPDYDDVFRAIGMQELVIEARNKYGAGPPDWNDEVLKELFEHFVIDTEPASLGPAIRKRYAGRVNGLFPNIMSAIPKVLPRQVVDSITFPATECDPEENRACGSSRR